MGVITFSVKSVTQKRFRTSILQSIAEWGKDLSGTRWLISQKWRRKKLSITRKRFFWNLEKFPLPMIKTWPKNKVAKYIRTLKSLTCRPLFWHKIASSLFLDPFLHHHHQQSIPRKDLRMLIWDRQDSLFYTRVSLEVVRLLSAISNLGYLWKLGG